MLRVFWLIAVLFVIVSAASCGTSDRPSDPAGGQLGQGSPPSTAGSALPALPSDGVQPWERVDGAGHVVPASRSAAQLPPGSEFAPGVERFLEGGDVADAGEASSLASGAAGGGALSYAMYRLTMAGAAPGTLALDVNLHPVSGSPAAEASAYFVAVSDYGAGHWRWLGSFTDGQLTLELPAGNYLSPLGNTFVAIAAYDGAQFDIVGVMASQLDGADTTAPPVPAIPSLAPVAGGLELAWTDVIAADLAGYRVLHSYSPFTATTDPGVKAWPHLENTTRFVLPLQPRTAFIALQAVDVNGNASGIGPVASGLPQPGALPQLELSLDKSSALLNESATLTFAGAALFDLDLDGDGTFELDNIPPFGYAVDTSGSGLIRPRVRGHDAAGTSVALGSVSLIVTGNQRPVASARVTPQQGVGGPGNPLVVSFLGGDSTDFDGSIEQWSWDRTGDGIFERDSDVSPDESGNFSVPGLYNAKLRVTDDGGAWDVDTVTVQVIPPSAGLLAQPSDPTPGQRVDLTAMPTEPVAQYDWDLDGDGTFETNTGADATAYTSFSEPGSYVPAVQMTLASGGTAIGIASVRVHGWIQDYDIVDNASPAGSYCSLAYGPAGLGVAFTDNMLHLSYLPSTGFDGKRWTWGAPITIEGIAGTTHCSLRIVNGRPAMAYYHSGDGDLKYALAANAEGSAWNPSLTPDGASIACGLNSWLEVINGNPAICYYDLTNTNLRYVRANDALGTSWGAPVYAVDSTDDVGQNCSMAEVDGAPAIVYLNLSAPNASYVRANDPNGATWGTPVPLGTCDNTISNWGLAVVNGRPAAIFTHNYDLLYIQAHDASGSSWPILASTVADSQSFIVISYLAEVGGVPMITFQDWSLENQMLARANDADGNTWTIEEALEGSSGTGNQTCSLIDLEGRPAVAYGNFDGLHFGYRY